MFKAGPHFFVPPIPEVHKTRFIFPRISGSTSSIVFVFNETETLTIFKDETNEN